MHAAVATTLWRSITIQTWREDCLHSIEVADLPQAYLQLATQLHFHSSIEYVTSKRCPHAHDYDNGWNSDSDEVTTEEEDGDEPVDQLPFDRLSQRVKNVLGRLNDDQLRSFR